MTKYFRNAFATGGDREAVPDQAVGTLVNYEKGYTPEYELDPDVDPAGNYVGRRRMNQLFNDITGNLKFWQENGVPEIVANDGTGNPLSYKKGFVGSYLGVIYRALIDDTATLPPSAEWVAYDLQDELDKLLKVSDLATTTGTSETTAMTQKAATDELNTRVKWVSGDKIITVADSGADFNTVMGAIAEAMKWRSIDGSVIVEIQSGYLVQEQLFFIDNDYSHINIKAQNGSTITVDHNSMSVTDFEGLGFSGFIVCARGKSPMIQTQFEFLTRPTSTINGALAVLIGEIYFGNNSGVKGAGSDGASAQRGGSVSMGDNNDFSGAGGVGAFAQRGSSVSMGDNNDFSGAGSDGAFSNRGSSVSMGDNNDFSGAGRYGANSTDGGSVVIGNNNNLSGIAVNGFSFRVGTNGFIQAGAATIFTSGRERNQAARTITTNGLIMG